MENPTHVGKAGEPGEGPYVVLHLLVRDGQILRATYQTNGCPAAIASARVLCQLVTGRDAELALRLEPSDLLAVLGGLPAGKNDCAARAGQALRDAIAGTCEADGPRAELEPE